MAAVQLKFAHTSHFEMGHMIIHLSFTFLVFAHKTPFKSF